MGKEFELKYQADAGKLAAIREKYGEFTPISMETTYYDTPDLKLAFHRWTLRRRLENGVRGEWEVESENIMSAVMELCQKGAPWELMRATAGGVQAMCGARFTRLAAPVELPGCTIELALDAGHFLGQGREEPFFEVEVELKDGSREAAEAFARTLAEEFGLIPEKKSKFVRAMAMIF